MVAQPDDIIIIIWAHEGVIPTHDICLFFSSDMQHLGKNLLDTDIQNLCWHPALYHQKP